ncbi:MAG: hypothetical protein ACLVKO_08775 [Dysgonomonas sp.]
MNKILIESTADGSHTLFIPEINEHYHSVNGALQESLHVFINAGLKQIPQKDISILEIGFGTGLNAYLTLVESVHSNKNINYVGIEKYPLSDCIVKSLNYSYLIRRTEDPVFQKNTSNPLGRKKRNNREIQFDKKKKKMSNC